MLIQGEFAISCDKSRLNLDVIHHFITAESYWGLGRSRREMAEAIENSILCFGLYHMRPAGISQVGFARMVGDNVVCGFLCDLFVLEAYRGQGLGKWLLHAIATHPDVARLRKVMLYTNTPKFYSDEHFAIYNQKQPAKFMEMARGRAC